MATAVQLAGTAFPTPLIQALPTLSGLQGWSYFGGDLTKSQNAAPGGVAYSNLGAGPAFQPNYARCGAVTPGAGVQTGITLFTAETVLVVARYVSGSVGASLGLVTWGANGLLLTPLTGGSTGVQIAHGGVTTSLVDPPITAWRFYAATIGGGVASAVYDLTNNLSNTGAVATITAAGTLKAIGQAPPSTNNQVVDIAFAASYNAIISKANIDLIYASVKQSLALRGIVV